MAGTAEDKALQSKVLIHKNLNSNAVDSDRLEGRTSMLDLTVGGQNGALQLNHEWTSSAGYVRQRVIAVLMSSPNGMRFMPEADKQVAALKALIEVLPLTIEGLDSSLTWEFSETPVGNAGEQFHTVVKGSRAVSAPAFTWSEKYGMAITRFWTEYGRMLLMDPDLGVPGIVTTEGFIGPETPADTSSPSILPADQTFTVLFIEPDETFRRVTNSWLCTNMMPKSGGEIIGKRSIGEAGEVPIVSIEFTAQTMIGSTVTKLAESYLGDLKIANMKPLELKDFLLNEELKLSKTALESIDNGSAGAGKGGSSFANSVTSAFANPGEGSTIGTQGN